MSIQHQHLMIRMLHIKIWIYAFSFKKRDLALAKFSQWLEHQPVTKESQV